MLGGENEEALEDEGFGSRINPKPRKPHRSLSAAACATIEAKRTVGKVGVCRNETRKHNNTAGRGQKEFDALKRP